MSLQDFKLENSHFVSSSILDLKDMRDDELESQHFCMSCCLY